MLSTVLTLTSSLFPLFKKTKAPAIIITQIIAVAHIIKVFLLSFGLSFGWELIGWLTLTFKLAPQCLQNLAPSLFSLPQLGHFIKSHLKIIEKN